MPVTAKLSRKFYETFGDEIANELVEWFNQVDATYRSDLRELNELNFARFDAKAEQRAVELEAKFDQRIGALEAKFNQRIGALEAKFNQRIGALEAKLDQRIAEVRAELMSELRGGLAEQRADLIRWMFLFWAGTVLPLAGLMVALLR
ncbi:MAG: hypothetical protein GTN62_15260 [Gemmatimonadales bacterium]|nr:hypothetical protein [Gemmatimonadales bacterium]NIN13170.1 hypothetical protein [Gemmatimonadales bacterium]NIN51448.1 hypothetical protein [Gemmatimonadales bacterium]NIP08912.1 hypothetical protein [Gemmatimonadales bacterium]NIR03700.1 hypothetical protein [Gemmatimonadales bacterium]